MYSPYGSGTVYGSSGDDYGQYMGGSLDQIYSQPQKVYSGRGNLTSSQMTDLWWNTPAFRKEGGSSGAFARYVQRQADAGFVSESPVIINAPTYSNPVVNAPVGGNSFQNTVLGQTLMSNDSNDIYGLPK